MTNKTEKISFRVSKNQRLLFEEYCNKQNISPSKLLYQFYNNIAFAEKSQREGKIWTIKENQV